jgi:hypothetical protein
MSALLLGFVIGAVFYVFGGRDSALGDLELPQRLGLVAVVGVVLLLVAMLFANEAPEGAQQPAQSDTARSAPQAAAPASEAAPAAGQEPAEEVAGGPTAAPPPDGPPSTASSAAPEPPAAPPAATSAESAEPPPPPAVPEAPEAAPGEAALQCVYSPDSGRCTCLDGRGYLVEVELERCRELATPDAD